MPMTTNPNEERKGSDGVHLRWDQSAGVLEFIFAESKIWQSFSDALRNAFESMEKFHDSRTKQYEVVNAFTTGFSSLDAELQTKVQWYIEGENVSNCRLVQACLIGFNWDEYGCLNDGRRAQFVKEFEARYRAWAAGIRDSLNSKLKAFNDTCGSSFHAAIQRCGSFSCLLSGRIDWKKMTIPPTTEKFDRIYRSLLIADVNGELSLLFAGILQRREI